ncbi:MAG TPA: CU044_2847 family protein [Jatrophihabitantaceae bacterium]|jgi:hypothetical protein|nr:CU044_2847 family protein [Jatrophihabitantaceae bacterium]
METVEASVGDVRLLIEAAQIPPPPGMQVLVTGEDGADPWATQQTGINPNTLIDAYGQLKGVLREIAADLGETFAAPGANRPSSVEVAFGLTFSGEANVWVMKAGGEVSLTVTLTWDRRSPHGG